MWRRQIVRTVLTLAVALAAVGIASPAFANIAHYDVRVDGLACPFCAYGLEKKLKALPGVSQVDIDLEAGRASFDVADATVLMPGRVEGAVRDAGFTARGFTVRATGTVQGEGDSLRLDVGESQVIPLRGGNAFSRLRALVADGHRSVAVTGAITQAGDGWQLRVDQVERRGS